jgi:hypothetical protein
MYVELRLGIMILVPQSASTEEVYIKVILANVARIAGLVALAGCVVRPNVGRGISVAGCYEPAIGPYLAYQSSSDIEEDDEFTLPPLYELTLDKSDELSFSKEEDMSWLSIRQPQITMPEMLLSLGAWRMIGADSILVQWRHEYGVVEYRLRVEEDRLIGQGTGRAHYPAPPISTYSVSAKRVVCD